MFEIKWEKYPVIDWELGNRLAGNQMDLAKDMLKMLTTNLPDDMVAINQSFAATNHLELLHRIHKLHGAVSYCGAPRLKAVLAIIEQQLKSEFYDDLSMLLNELNVEVKNLINEYEVSVITA